MALLLSSVDDARRAQLRNPAAVKQVLTEGARRLDGPSFFEQGMGELEPAASAALIADFTPHVSALPPTLDLSDCPFMSPYCEQPLFHAARPLALNLTIVNSRCAVSRLQGRPRWVAQHNGHALDVRFSWDATFAPWGGFLGVRLVVPAGAVGW